MRPVRPFFAARWLFPEAVFRTGSSGKSLCMTFDDGPDQESTPELLDILDKANVKAVFFCNGSSAEKHPGLITEIKRRGHLVGNHGYRHLNGWKTPAGTYRENAEQAAELTSGELFRPPYGKIGIRQYRQLRKKFRIIFWDVMSYDFDPSFGAERSLKLLAGNIRPGSVIVLHDTPASTCRAFLPGFIRTAENMGFKFETHFEMLHLDTVKSTE